MGLKNFYVVLLSFCLFTGSTGAVEEGVYYGTVVGGAGIFRINESGDVDAYFSKESGLYGCVFLRDDVFETEFTVTNVTHGDGKDVSVRFAEVVWEYEKEEFTEVILYGRPDLGSIPLGGSKKIAIKSVRSDFSERLDLLRGIRVNLHVDTQGDDGVVSSEFMYIRFMNASE